MFPPRGGAANQVLGHGKSEAEAISDAHFKLCYVIRNLLREDVVVPSPSARGLARTRSLLSSHSLSST
jgi:hypothetical protein